MRICLAGSPQGNLDEGMKNVAANIAEQLARRHEVHIFDPRKVRHLRTWLSVRRFRPDIIHYLPGPSTMSFVISRTLSRASGNPPVLLTVLHPGRLRPKPIIRLLRPDGLITVSERGRVLLGDIGCPMWDLALGVDLKKFHPPRPNERDELRDKYGIRRGAFVILHVGNLRAERNAQTLTRFIDSQTEVVLVSSTSVAGDRWVSEELLARGAHVIDSYLPNIDEVYRLADLFVFPVVKPENAIEFPLTVLEAMASNLPVVSTMFGGLPDHLPSSAGLVWYSSEEELAHAVAVMRKGPAKAETRVLAERFSWEHVADELETIYNDTLAKRCPSP